jgi:hypothetical protein
LCCSFRACQFNILTHKTDQRLPLHWHLAFPVLLCNFNAVHNAHTLQNPNKLDAITSQELQNCLFYRQNVLAR